MSLSPSVIRPRVGRSNPVSRLTSVVLPAPLGPISPTASPAPSSRSTSESASTPSNARETPRARSESGPRVRAWATAVNVRPPARASVDVRDLLGGVLPDVDRLVVVHLDHPVGPAGRAVRRDRVAEADRPAERLEVLQVREQAGERRAVG